MCKKNSCDVYYIWEKNKLIKQLVFSKKKKKKKKNLNKTQTCLRIKKPSLNL